MPITPAITAALTELDFSERGINTLFRACLTAAGIEWEIPAAFALIERLWQNDSVISAIEALQDAVEAEQDTEPQRARLLAAINEEIREPAE